MVVAALVRLFETTSCGRFTYVNRSFLVPCEAMRPDQHKKKASAAYKKKHGIKDTDKKQEKGGKNVSTKGNQEAFSGKASLKSSAPSDGRKYVDLPEFSSSDEEQVNLRELSKVMVGSGNDT